jgi:hypothetical protein
MYTEVGVPDRLPDDALAGVGARTEFVDMAPADFVRACELQDGENPPYHYYTAGIAQHAAGFAEQVRRRPHGPSRQCGVPSRPAARPRRSACALNAVHIPEQACPGWERLVVDELACSHRMATPAHSSLWVGGSGSTTQAHYDVLHNVFVQVHRCARAAWLARRVQRRVASSP